MKRLTLMLMTTFFVALAACGGEKETSPEPDAPEEMSKEEARALGGKSDHFDFCEWFGWYGDGVCDSWCPEPDPDCGIDVCTSDSDCPGGYCEHFASCLATNCPPPPPPQCVASQCEGDGSTNHPLCDIVPACEEGQVAVVNNGCFECVDARTCDPVTPPSCDDGSAVHPLCDIAIGCDSGLVSAVQNGCFTCVDPVTCEEPDATGQFCGGIAGLLCPTGFTCVQSPGMCNVADAGGSCQPAADACAQVFDPVCGCDGQTYSNDCMAQLAGASVDHAGECDDDGGTIGDACGSRGLPTCGADEYCNWDPADICGAADAPGVCTKRPEACITLFDPVCGCDGNTYSNGCFAASAGVSVSSDGPCN